jgi:periplasmic protein TonB
MSGHIRLDLDPPGPGSGTGAEGLPARTPAEPPEPGAAPAEVTGVDELFGQLVVSNPSPLTKRARTTLRLSAVAHVAIIAAVVLLPLLAPPPPPNTPDYIRALIYDPPPPPPPPPPKGSALVPKLERAKPVSPDVKKPEKPKLEDPTPTPQESPLKPEARAPESEQYGSPSGSDLGVPEGMEGGVEGGQVGGVPGGVLGGVIGGTGTGPVMDYDSPPRPIRLTKPQYPHDAFVKKIEGVVIVEILIDSTGHVAQARVVQSIPQLDAAALQTVSQWLFSPAVKRGRPVATLARAPVTFRIF